MQRLKRQASQVVEPGMQLRRPTLRYAAVVTRGIAYQRQPTSRLKQRAFRRPNQIGNQMEWLVPWMAASGPSDFVDELHREAPIGHRLWWAPVRCLGFRKDCDDVLFSLEDGSGRVAIVHLTYRAETDAAYPSKEISASLEEFIEKQMRPDHEDWED